MKKIWTIVSALFLFGCMSQDIKLSGEYKLQNASEDAEITLSFDGSDFNGLAAINRYFGTFEKHDRKIKFNVVGTTMMMGPQNLMKVEQDYIKTLSEVDSLIQKNDTLILQTSSQDKLIFIKTK